MLGISPRTLSRLLRSGQIPSVKLQGRRLFSVSALAKWIEERLSYDPLQGRQARRRKTDGQQGGQHDGQSAQRAKARGQQHT